jgi:hypothetical protein
MVCCRYRLGVHEDKHLQAGVVIRELKRNPHDRLPKNNQIKNVFISGTKIQYIQTGNMPDGPDNDKKMIPAATGKIWRASGDDAVFRSLWIR